MTEEIKTEEMHRAEENINNKNKKKKKKSRKQKTAYEVLYRQEKSFFLWCKILILISLVCDLNVSPNLLFGFVKISASYVNIVFTAIFTVATLGSVVMTLIVNSFSQRYFGIRLKDILKFQSFKLQTTKVLPIVLLSVVAALWCLIFNWINTITIILFLVIFFLTMSSDNLWKIITDDQVLLDIIQHEMTTEYFCNDTSRQSQYLEAWIDQLKSNIEVRDEKKQFILISLIDQIRLLNFDKIEEAHKDIMTNLKKDILEMFPLAQKHLGFVDAYKKIVRLNYKNAESFFNENNIFHSFFDLIKYYPDEMIYQFYSEGNFSDILRSDDIDSSNKIYILFWYYQSIYENYVIDPELKFSLLNNMFIQLFSPQVHLALTVEDIRDKVLMHVIKHFILENADDKGRGKLFQQILIAFKYNYSVVPNTLEIEDARKISIIFQALYIFSQYETEQVTDDFRNKIQNLLVDVPENKIDRNNMSVIDYIKAHSKIFIKSQIEDLIVVDELEYGHIFEYFPKARSSGKNSVWMFERRAKVTVYLYLLLSNYAYEINWFDEFDKIIDEEQQKRFFRLSQIVSQWFNDNQILTEDIRKEISSFAAFIDTRDEVKTYPLKNLYGQIEKINIRYNQVIKDEKKLNSIDIHREVKAIEKKIKDKILMENQDSAIESSMYLLDVSVPIIDSTETMQRVRVINLLHGIYDNADDFIMGAIDRYINQSIENHLEQVDIDYSKQGLDGFLSELNKPINSDIISTTYPLNNLEYSTYQKIKAYKNLKIKKTQRKLFKYIFIRKDAIRYNFEIVDYNRIAVTDPEEISNFIGEYEVAQGRYKINGALYTDLQAKEFFKDLLFKEYVIFKVAIDLKEGDGFYITTIRDTKTK